MTSLSFRDEVAAQSNGFELLHLDDFRGLLDEVQSDAQRKFDVGAAVNVLHAKERLDLLVRIMPNAHYVLWKRHEDVITLAPSIESLRAEFPWLRSENAI